VTHAGAAPGPIEDGDDEYIEVEIDPADLGESVELVSADGRVYQAARSLGAAMDRLLPAVDAILDRFRRHRRAPDEIELELGLKLGGETGVIFAKGTSEATFNVKLTWRRPG
jgi:hypothetical protein